MSTQHLTFGNPSEAKGVWNYSFGQVLNAVISCTDCGAIGTLDHTISSEGLVTPSVVCPRDCGYHEVGVILSGWDPNKKRDTVELDLTPFRPNVTHLFPDAYAEEDKETILARVQERWDLDGELPIPKWDVTCPSCQAKMSDHNLQGRIWNLHKRNDGASKIPFRCDVSFKCRICSFVMVYGVIITEEMYGKARTKSGHSWREVHSIVRKQKNYKHPS